MAAKSFDWDRQKSLFPVSAGPGSGREHRLWKYYSWGPNSECGPWCPACTPWSLVLGCGPCRPRSEEGKEAEDCLITRSPWPLQQGKCPNWEWGRGGMAPKRWRSVETMGTNVPYHSLLTASLTRGSPSAALRATHCNYNPSLGF